MDTLATAACGFAAASCGRQQPPRTRGAATAWIWQTSARVARRWALVALIVALPVPVWSACVGDCGEVGHVSAADLVLMAHIAVGNRALAECSPDGTGDDSRITADDIEQAVRSIFGACSEGTSPYDALAVDLYQIAYPTRLIGLVQAAAIVAGLEMSGSTDEAELRALLPQLLAELGVDPERIEATTILAPREQEGSCEDCLATCSGRCVQNPQGECFCYERLPTDPARSIAILLLERPEDETPAFAADRIICKDTVLHAGVNDSFGTANGIEPATQSAGLLALIQGASQTPANYDQTAIDRLFGQSFTLPQGKCLAAAKVLLRVRPIASSISPGSRNDVLRLGFVSPAGQFVGPVWSAYIGSGSANTGLPLLLNQQWTASNFPAPGASFVLNLASLPGGMNLLPALDAQRFLDVYEQDDSSVDYVDLLYRLCDCPQPTRTPTLTRTPTPSPTPGPCSLTVCKQTTPAGGTGFSFSSAFSGLQGITLNDGQCVQKPLACGPLFNVFEVPKPGSTLTNIACSFSPGAGSFSIIGASVNPTGAFQPGDNEVHFALNPGANLQCFFTNAIQPTPTATVTRTAPSTSTPTPRPTATATRTAANTATRTNTPTRTATRTVTATPSATASATPVGTTTCIPPPANMVAWWPLDDAAGANTVVDIAAPPTNHGVPQPGSVQPFPPANPGPATVAGNLATNPAERALYFYTPATYVEVPHGSDLALANADLTIDAWMNPLLGPWTAGRDSVHIYPIVDKLDLAANTGYAFFVQVQTYCPTCPPAGQQPPPSGAASTTIFRLVVAIGNGAGLSIYASATIYSGSGTIFPFPTPPSLLTPQPPGWTHVAVSIDRGPSFGQYYVNGAHLVGSDFVPAAGVNNTAPLWIGGSRLYGTVHAPNFVEFTLNEIEVFDAAIAQADIQAIASTSGGKCKETPSPSPTPTPTQGCVAPPPNMVGWWTADNTTADFSGNGNHGTFFQAPGMYTAGKVGAAFSFPGIPDFVQASPSLNFTGNFSMDAWIRTTNAAQAPVIDKRLNAGGNAVGYYLFVFGGALAFELGDGQPSVYQSPGPFISDGNWHHVAATVDRTSTTGGHLYVDGALVHTFDPTTRPGSIANGFSLRIGQQWVSAIAFQGAIDEVELFDRELAAQEIQAIYGANTAGKCKTPLPTRTVTATGTVTATPTRTPTPQCVAELCVFKFNDLDGDGVHDAGEPGLAGWTIHVVDPAMNVITTSTGAGGGFCIGVPAPKSYTAVEVPQAGWTQTFPPPPGSHAFEVDCGSLVNLEFGNHDNAVSTPTRTATATATRTSTRTLGIPPVD